jgi:hypothetical protein
MPTQPSGVDRALQELDLLRGQARSHGIDPLRTFADLAGMFPPVSRDHTNTYLRVAVRLFHDKERGLPELGPRERSDAGGFSRSAVTGDDGDVEPGAGERGEFVMSTRSYRSEAGLAARADRSRRPGAAGPGDAFLPRE